ncbi:MAG: hydrogenase maturation nickel metallochaperone HypA [Anaerolineales bacterium]|nr:hydrogenase maturation nickel metallochaperone HypA [Anaerolineales bacterium]
MQIHPRLVAIYQQVLHKPVKNISIALGELISLDESNLRAQWHELVKNTPLEKKSLTIRIIPAEQQCMVCFLKYHPKQKETACPQCKSVGAKIISGEEFYLEEK